jgi:hypothetical protein
VAGGWGRWADGGWQGWALLAAAGPRGLMAPKAAWRLLAAGGHLHLLLGCAVPVPDDPQHAAQLLVLAALVGVPRLLPIHACSSGSGSSGRLVPWRWLQPGALGARAAVARRPIGLGTQIAGPRRSRRSRHLQVPLYTRAQIKATRWQGHDAPRLPHPSTPPIAPPANPPT